MAFTLTPAAPALTVGGPPRVNLLPRVVTERRSRNRLLRRWAWALVAALALVGVAAAGAFTLQTAAAVRLATANSQTTELLGRIAALQPVSQRLALQAELGDMRAQAMGTDLRWAGVLDAVRSALPADVGIASYALSPGGLPQGDDPTREEGARGTLVFTSGTPTDIVALIRTVRALPGVLDADGWADTLAGAEYEYELRVTFDQSVYTGAYAKAESQ